MLHKSHGNKSSRFGARTAVYCAGVLLLLLAAATPAQALTRGWFMGVGLANQSLAGEIDGKTTLVGVDHTVQPGRLESGGGFSLTGGYNMDINFGLEFLIASTNHKALHTVAGAQTAKLTSSTLAARIATGGRRLDLFARLGWGVRTLTYDTAATTTLPQQSAKLTGRGGSYGVGFEHLSNNWGLEAAYNVDKVRYDHVDAGTTSGNLNPGVYASVRALLFSVNYYFR